jgi:hypothetical protein
MKHWPAYLVILAVAFLGGRLSKRPEVRTETKTVVQERIEWVSNERTDAVTSAAAEKQENVRVVTRWLRRDGSTSKERTTEAASATTSQASTAVQTSAVSSRESSRASASHTDSDPTYQPRLQAGGLLGLDLRDRAARKYGAYATWRVVGPVTVGGWWVPGMAGASLGISF